ncbi:MAG: hypothetical protein JWO36_2666 [Myxococcales bacterium]|nr:hypothetical protein [Myxococcales bacterium]
MRAVLVVLGLAGCAELGVISDGTSISVGKASHGYLIDGARLPDQGEGFTTREVWQRRNNRYGTDELIDLVTGVARRMATHVHDVKIVVGDLSGLGGGGAFAFHRSHQSGRDADFVYYMRDADGKPFEPDAMHVFDGKGRARDQTGLTVDVPRTWLLVKELVAAPEAPVQYVFMYEPIAQMLLEHAAKIGEPDAVIAAVRKALKQPGDSARHDDHMHVRIYCSDADKDYGCVDYGPMEMLAQRQAQTEATFALVSGAVSRPAENRSAFDVGSPPLTSTSTPTPQAPLRSLLRTGADRIDLRGWR